MEKRKVRSQPRIKGIVRRPSHTSLLPAIDIELRRIARYHGVTPSWVKASILADVLHVEMQQKYYDESPKMKTKKRGRR